MTSAKTSAEQRQPVGEACEAGAAEAGAAGAGHPVAGERDEACRAMRADARRNYELLVQAARQVFAEQGGGASMEAVARTAGVGIGTLYRHFPKRIDLVEAVYRNDVEELVAVAEKAVANSEPWPAVEEFLHAFVDYGQRKRTFLNELHEAFEKNPDLKIHAGERIDWAMELVIGRAQHAGVARADVASADVRQLIAPMCTSAAVSAEQSERLLRMIIDGLRPPATAT